MKSYFALAVVLLANLWTPRSQAAFNSSEFSGAVEKKIEALKISAADFRKILNYVSNNEFGDDPDGIVAWGEEEDFASLGVGHFIWYPQGEPHRFEESFPKFATFLGRHWNFSGLSAREAALFSWAKDFIYRADGTVKFCPWRKRSHFLEWKERDRESFRRLVAFLHHPQIYGVQAQYLETDFRESLVEVVQDVKSRDELDAMEAPATESIERVRKLMATNILALLGSRWGYVALLDYINFKGDGTDKKMRYGGLGWGLEQALYFVRAADPLATVQSFSLATLSRLERRVGQANNPIERRQWIHGWCNRVLGYGYVDADPTIRALARQRLEGGALKWPKLHIGDRALRIVF